MQTPAAAQPRRTVIWDEANAQYIWLDASARDANRAIRARRADFQNNDRPGLVTCGLGAVWDPAEYDGQTRSRASAREYSRTNNRQKRQKRRTDIARRAGKPLPSALVSSLPPLSFDDVLPFLVDAWANLEPAPTIASLLE